MPNATRARSIRAALRPVLGRSPRRRRRRRRERDFSRGRSTRLSSADAASHWLAAMLSDRPAGDGLPHPPPPPPPAASKILASISTAVGGGGRRARWPPLPEIAGDIDRPSGRAAAFSVVGRTYLPSDCRRSAAAMAGCRRRAAPAAAFCVGVARRRRANRARRDDII